MWVKGLEASSRRDYGPWTVPEADAERAMPLIALLEGLSRRDPQLTIHGESVGGYAASVAIRLGIPPARAERLRLAGIVHDIGKIVVLTRILQKRGPLTASEWAQVKRHPQVGFRLIHSTGLHDVAGWTLTHHERPDGLGYPFGLGAGEIPIESSIISACDAYHAMIDERPYQAAMDHGQARAELIGCAGTQFDPMVVEALLLVAEERVEVAGRRFELRAPVPDD